MREGAQLKTLRPFFLAHEPQLAQVEIMKYGKARRKPGVMNSLESKYALHLEAKRIAGEIFAYAFESITLKLAEGCRYTPDFLVINREMECEFHEVKGFWVDDARVKIKVAASKFPFRFVGVQYKKKEWQFEEFAGGSE